MPKNSNLRYSCLLICLGLLLTPVKKIQAQDEDAAEKAGKEFDDLDKELDNEPSAPQKPSNIKAATKSLDQELDQDLEKELDQQAPVKAQTSPPPATIEAPKEPEKAEIEQAPEPPVAEPSPKLKLAPKEEATPVQVVKTKMIRGSKDKLSTCYVELK